jgi:hypothetical protein
MQNPIFGPYEQKLHSSRRLRTGGDSSRRRVAGEMLLSARSNFRIARGFLLRPNRLDLDAVTHCHPDLRVDSRCS